jgi:hypothetical protein
MNFQGRNRFTGPLPPEERFWAKVCKTENCWLWQGSIGDRNGHGRFYLSDGTAIYAHRFSYELHFGKIPEGLFVCHRCDNPRCVRPDHLFLGTNQENIIDAWNKGRMYDIRSQHPDNSGENQGSHKLTWKSVEAIRQTKGVPQGILANQYGVNQSTISRILKAQYWREDE